jgi:putative ABC transport system permease protein
VIGATLASQLPRMHHARREIEVDGGAGSGRDGKRHTAGAAAVAITYFDTLGAPILAGRGFREGDRRTGARVAIVNQAFVTRLFGGGHPIGRRIRYVNPTDPRPQPWFEIVGAVKDLGVTSGDASDDGAGIYHPLPASVPSSVHMAVHVKGDPKAFVPRLRAIGADVDPRLRLEEPQRLDEGGASLWLESQFLYRLLAGLSGIALLLALTGIYSILAFSVSRRTREIGIRLALGADARRIITGIFSRALAQVALGIACGGVLVFVLTRMVTGLSMREAAIIAGYMLVMLAVCTLACSVPARRALSVAPTEALREG